VEELRAYIRGQQREQERQKAIEAEARSVERAQKEQGIQQPSTARAHHPLGSPVRKDSSPIKVRVNLPFFEPLFSSTARCRQPLSGILNTDLLLSKPHTAAQVSALWTALHASRSGGTGRGFICASLPRGTYDSLLSVAQRYPKFVIPIPHATMTAGDTKDATSNAAYEFYVLQWDFYHAPPLPHPTDPFARKAPTETDKHANPRLATAIFTPLLEYKLRQTFATPYLVLTFYSDLASSHDLVLMRGEITPTASAQSTTGDYLLSQHDAQLLAHGLQRFYLWGSSKEREKLLSDFHERPDTFKWEELLKHADFGT
jgi:ATP synthase mitochondrial F1 complex assembly factor 1